MKVGWISQTIRAASCVSRTDALRILKRSTSRNVDKSCFELLSKKAVQGFKQKH